MEQPFDEPLGTSLEAGTVRIERLLPGPIENVWAYLTESDSRAKWLAPGDMELRVGGEVALHFSHSELSHEPTPERWCRVDGVLTGCVTQCVPPHLLSFTWPLGDGEESEVTFELSAREDGVLLVVTHRRLRDRAQMANVASGWHAHLGLLIDHLQGRAPRGFWSAFADAEKRYEGRFAAG